MDRMLSGLEIVSKLARGRDWWRLQACDVQSWAATLPPSATLEHISRVEWVGEAWDGSSDIQVGDEAMSGKDVARLLHALRQGISALGLPRISLPDASNVRQCFGAIGSRQKLAIDIDFEDFVVPLSLDEHHLGLRDRPSIAAIGAGMLRIISAIDGRRASIQSREQRLRRAFEETIMKIGNGAAPLWFRMNPLDFDEKASQLSHPTFLMLTVLLNDQLVWAPTGSELVTSLRQIRSQHGYHVHSQQKRATAIANLREAGSVGWISDTALAIIEERGLKPGEAFRRALQVRWADRRGGLEFTREGKRETLYVDDGVLIASIQFAGGHHYRDQLILWDYPEKESVATAKGRRLSDFANHPAFVATEAVVHEAELRSGHLELTYEARLTSVEHAEAQQLASDSNERGPPLAA